MQYTPVAMGDGPLVGGLPTTFPSLLEAVPSITDRLLVTFPLPMVTTGVFTLLHTDVFIPQSVTPTT